MLRGEPVYVSTNKKQPRHTNVQPRWYQTRAIWRSSPEVWDGGRAKPTGLSKPECLAVLCCALLDPQQGEDVREKCRNAKKAPAKKKIYRSGEIWVQENF